MKLRVDNTSGVTGVHFDRKRNKWRASAFMSTPTGRKTVHLGRFETKETAIAARQYYLRQQAKAKPPTQLGVNA